MTVNNLNLQCDVWQKYIVSYGETSTGDDKLICAYAREIRGEPKDV